jgi:hypothetical protein
MKAEKAVAIQRTCPTCQGLKVITGPTTCQLCGQEIPTDDPWWDCEESTLPCGHSAANNLVEQALTCPECAGHGRTRQWISQAEWQHIQRQRVVRGLVLLVVSLLVIFSLVWAVGSREPDYVCGSWWYGLIPLWLLMWRR